MTVNKVILVARLGADPELKFLPSGIAVCSLRAATNRKWTDKEGKACEKTEWHRINVWGKQGEACGQHLRVGSMIFVDGEIESRTYTDKNGAERISFEIKARDVRFLGGKNDGQSRSQSPTEAMGYGSDSGYAEPGSEVNDLPF